MFARVSLCILAITASACSRRPVDATPESTVREFFERMKAVRGDPQDGKLAFDLLSKHAQANLTARAQRYSAASGKPIGPESMITPSRFVPRFLPQRYTTTQVAGTFALVDVAGLHDDEHAKVQCVFEDVGWRVDLTLPPLPPVQLRPGSQTP